MSMYTFGDTDAGACIKTSSFAPFGKQETRRILAPIRFLKADVFARGTSAQDIATRGNGVLAAACMAVMLITTAGIKNGDVIKHVEGTFAPWLSMGIHDEATLCLVKLHRENVLHHYLHLALQTPNTKHTDAIFHILTASVA